MILGPRGSPVLSLACVRGTSEVLVIVYAIKPSGAQQELTLRLDDSRFVFVLKPQALKDGKVVEAAAKAGPPLLNAIRGAKSMRVTYGESRLGPYAGPPPALTSAFVERCEPLI